MNWEIAEGQHQLLDSIQPLWVATKHTDLKLAGEPKRLYSRPVENSKQPSDGSSRPQLTYPLWQRLGLAAAMFLIAILGGRKGVLEWAPFLGFGLYWLILVPRQNGEPLGEYFKKPYAIASTTVLLAALGGFVLRLYIVWSK